MMRFLSLFLILTINVFASDLENGDRARFNYEATSVYKILSARAVLHHEGQGHYSGNLRVGALVEGNICNNNRNSLGTFELPAGNITKVFFLVRHLKTNDNVMCAQYSKEVRISTNIKVSVESGKERIFELNGHTITLQEKDGSWQTIIENQENLQ